MMYIFKPSSQSNISSENIKNDAELHSFLKRYRILVLRDCTLNVRTIILSSFKRTDLEI